MLFWGGGWEDRKNNGLHDALPISMGLCVGLALGSNTGMNVGPALGLFMGPTDVIWYGPGEGNQYGINMGVDEENILGRNKGRGGWSNTGLWPIYTSCDFLE